MNHGAAMRHGKARLCRAECPTHFLFVLPKRKRAGHGTKEKTLRDDLTRRCQITQNGGLAVTNCRPNPEVSYRLRCTYSARNCVPAPESPPHTGVLNRTPPASLSAAAPRPRFPSLGGGSKGGPCPRPSSLVPLGVGFQRRGPRPPAFVSFQGGAGGNRNPPAFLFRGAGGDILFSKENIPLGFSPRKPGPPFVGAEKPDRPLR